MAWAAAGREKRAQAEEHLPTEYLLIFHLQALLRGFPDWLALMLPRL